jgi:hypothetical protein
MSPSPTAKLTPALNRSIDSLLPFRKYITPMNSSIMRLFGQSGWKALLLIPVLALALCGCKTKDYGPELQPPSDTDPIGILGARLHAGDSVTITLSGLPLSIDPLIKTVGEDGNITLDSVGAVKAAGRTAAELQTAIHDAYVPQYYTHLDVTVTPGDRVFYVSGEVKMPGRQIYVGQITVTRAITSAGDFSDYANRRSVWLTRANGKRFKINCNAVLSGEAPDPPVFPGDSIVVDRRLY